MKILEKKIRHFQRNALDGIVRHSAHKDLQRRAEFFVSIFESYLPKESNVLDIGGGWGFYKRPLEKHNHSVTVLDVVKPGYQEAPVVIYEGDQIPFQDKSFDASMFITVLHHIPSPEAVIQEAIRVTKKRLIVVEDIYHHSLGRWWTVLRDRIYNFEYIGHPCQFRTAEQWCKTFESLGCKQIFQKDVYTWLTGMRILNGIFIFDLE